MLIWLIYQLIMKIFHWYFQVLKLYAWEESFITKITEIRNKELRHLTNSMYLGAAVSFTFICAPFLVRKWISLFQFKNTGVFDVFYHTRKIVFEHISRHLEVHSVTCRIYNSLLVVWNLVKYGLSCLIYLLIRCSNREENSEYICKAQQ